MTSWVAQLLKQWLGVMLVGIVSVAIGEGVTYLITGRWTLLPAVRGEPLTYCAILLIAAAVGVTVRRFRPTDDA